MGTSGVNLVDGWVPLGLLVLICLAAVYFVGIRSGK